MKFDKIGLLVLVIGIVTTSGCATYRTSSNIKLEPTSVVDITTPVIITEGDLQGQKVQ